MPRITVTLDDDLHDEIVAMVEEGEYSSKAEAVRQCVQETADLRAELDEARTTIDRLKAEKRQILDQQETHEELVRVVERERSLEEQKAAAGIVTRARWFLVGRDE